MKGLHGDNELTVGQVSKNKRLVLFLNEKGEYGPEWSVEAQDDWTAEPGLTWTEVKLESDELVLHWGDHRPAVKFTEEGMTTICPLCGELIQYVDLIIDHTKDERIPTWFCTKCGHGPHKHVGGEKTG